MRTAPSPGARPRLSRRKDRVTLAQQHPDLWPLVIVGALLFMTLFLAVVPGADALPPLVYIFGLLILSALLYTKGVRPFDPGLPSSLFWLALLARMYSALFFFWLVTDLYSASDAAAYHRGGQYVAPYLKQLDFSILGKGVRGSPETNNIIYLTGLVYAFLPPSLLGIGFLFAGLAFAGSVLFYRAYRVVFPDESPGLFRLGVFFLPSILVWTSAVGKDALTYLLTGIIAYGLASYLRQRRLSGLLWVALGLLSTWYIRPHVAAFIGLATVGAFLLSAFGSQAGGTRRLAAAILAGVILIVGFVSLRSEAGYELLDFEGSSLADARAYYEGVQGTYTGSGSGSSFQAPSVFQPAEAGLGVVTVLLRPFLWEARNPQALLASLESLLLLGAIWLRRRVLWSRLRSFRVDPWIAFISLYCLVLIVFLTAMGNFGLLARQRVMLLPFLLMLFA